MKKFLAILLTAALLLLSGCGSSPSQPQTTTESAKPQSSQSTTAGAETLSLYPAAANLPVGRELKLKATLSPAGASAQWTSSDEAVATVDENGNVVAKAPGECTVTAESGGKSAECAVLVEEECRTVIFTTKPVKGDGETPPEPPEGGGSEPPIELPPEVIDVEHLPEADEFVWTLTFEETYTTTVTSDGFTLPVELTFSFRAEKQGGKTAIGAYTGTFSGDGDLVADEFIRIMNASPEIQSAGGRVVDYQENDEGMVDASVTVQVTEMEDNVYHEGLYGYIPESERTITEQLPLPISQILPGSLMGLGSVSGSITISGTITIEVEGQTVTGPFGTNTMEDQAYNICIYPSGSALLTFPQLARDGIARNWVEGMLTKRPLM